MLISCRFEIFLSLHKVQCVFKYFVVFQDYFDIIFKDCYVFYGIAFSDEQISAGPFFRTLRIKYAFNPLDKSAHTL